MYTREIARKTRKSDGTLFRIYDDLPELGHYYTIEYLKEFAPDFHAWCRHTPGRIKTLEQAHSMLDEITEG